MHLDGVNGGGDDGSAHTDKQPSEVEVFNWNLKGNFNIKLFTALIMESLLQGKAQYSWSPY